MIFFILCVLVFISVVTMAIVHIVTDTPVSPYAYLIVVLSWGIWAIPASFRLI